MANERAILCGEVPVGNLPLGPYVRRPPPVPHETTVAPSACLGPTRAARRRALP